MRRVAVLSGGVGGARFLRGLVEVAEPARVTVVGNVGDDVEVLGLHVSPDLDSILYALAGVADDERGWGRADESWRAIGRWPGWTARRGSSWATATRRPSRPDAGAPGRGAFVGGHARLADAFGSASRSCRRPTTVSGRGSTLRPGRSPSRSGSSAAGTRTTSTECGSTARSRCSTGTWGVEAIADAELIVIAPSNPFIRSGRSSPLPRSARRSSGARFRVSPSARSSRGGP